MHGAGMAVMINCRRLPVPGIDLRPHGLRLKYPAREESSSQDLVGVIADAANDIEVARRMERVLDGIRPRLFPAGLGRCFPRNGRRGVVVPVPFLMHILAVVDGSLEGVHRYEIGAHLDEAADRMVGIRAVVKLINVRRLVEERDRVFEGVVVGVGLDVRSVAKLGFRKPRNA